MSIPTLQQQFMESIFKRDAGIYPHIVEGSISAEGRMKIYRNSTYGILIDCLKNSYPVLHALTGDDFFEALATHFITETPPTKGDITDYGWELPTFMANFPPVQNYLYFVDIAKLENDRQQAYYAPAKKPLLAEEVTDEIQPWLQPHVFIQSSDYAIHSIWLAHQEDTDIPEIEINTPEHTLTYRKEMDIFTQKISAEDFLFLQALQTTNNLDEALAAAPNFNPQALLVLLLKNHLLTGEK